jgi:hypothetical protein
VGSGGEIWGRARCVLSPGGAQEDAETKAWKEQKAKEQAEKEVGPVLLPYTLNPKTPAVVDRKCAPPQKVLPRESGCALGRASLRTQGVARASAPERCIARGRLRCC